jgi:hypothetical protein
MMKEVTHNRLADTPSLMWITQIILQPVSAPSSLELTAAALVLSVYPKRKYTLREAGFVKAAGRDRGVQ